jgi:hypothetical protein
MSYFKRFSYANKKGLSSKNHSLSLEPKLGTAHSNLHCTVNQLINLA